MQNFLVFASGRKAGGAPFQLRTSVVAESVEQAREIIERDYDFEDALTLNFEIFPDEDLK